jgi:uncharacterized protein (TIGR00730 family)
MKRLRLHERIAAEVLTSQRLMHGIGESVSLFGGSRVKKGSIHYNAARETGRLLSEAGISVITGGGPGVMEAGNEGARLGKKGKSVGLLITLPFEETANTHLDISIPFEHFASRKVTFCRYSEAFVFFPGGVGTLDEFGEVLALLSTNKMPSVPVLMYDSQFWLGMVEWMRMTMLRQGLVDARVLDSLIFVDHPQDVLEQLRQQKRLAVKVDGAPAIVATASFNDAIQGSGLEALLGTPAGKTGGRG